MLPLTFEQPAHRGKDVPGGQVSDPQLHMWPLPAAGSAPKVKGLQNPRGCGVCLYPASTPGQCLLKGHKLSRGRSQRCRGSQTKGSSLGTAGSVKVPPRWVHRFTCPLCKHQEAPGEGKREKYPQGIGKSNVRNQAAGFNWDVIRQGKGRRTVAAEDLRPVRC